MATDKPDPTIPDPDRFRTDTAAAQGQDLGRAMTEMAEEDMAAAGDRTPKGDGEAGAHG